MGTVLHFMSDRMESPACGAKVFLCSDYTDDQRHVDCLRCKRTTAFRGYDPERYRVDVWNQDGEVIRHARDLTADEVDALRNQYEDRPYLSVVVEKN